jgi:hypothetical protein
MMRTNKLETNCSEVPLPSCSARAPETLVDARPSSVDGWSATRDGVPQLVNTRAAATILSRSVNTLKRWRYEGVGPDYVVIEGRVSYDLAVLRDYIAQNTRVPSVRASWEATRGAL